MAITYALEPDLSAEAFREVLIASTLGARRPVDDLARLERMLQWATTMAPITPSSPAAPAPARHLRPASQYALPLNKRDQ